jgi:predicted O-methyltransferase YrrM
VTRFEAILARARARYALHLYLPASNASHHLRRLSRVLRGKPPSRQPTRLPQVAWSAALPERPVRLVETEKRHGNVSAAELAVLALAAAHASPGGEIIEIGTFDGRTTLNLALNAPADARIVTLDLPADEGTVFAIEQAERSLIDKPASGVRLRSCAPSLRRVAARIQQVFGDSARYDWSPHAGRAALVFVDGSHAYDYVLKDSETALRLVQPRGMVVWHDYGVWPGVTRGLEELEMSRKLGLRHLRGTSLVVWRAPER